MKAQVLSLVRAFLAGTVGLLLASCGGGGGGGSSGGSTTPPPSPAPISFTGVVAPPLSVSASGPPALVSVGTLPTDMLLPPGAPITDFPGVAQEAQYTVDPSSLPSLKITAVSFPSTNLSLTTMMRPTIAATGYAGDPSLGQLAGISASPLGVAISPGTGTLSIDNTLAQPSVLLSISGAGFTATEGYALPHSAALNPAGFTYQTFGGWSSVALAPIVTDGFFSAGIPTAAAMPAAGVASYSGQGDGTFVNATGDPFDVTATVTAQVDFQALSLSISIAAATASSNAPAGTPHNSDPALNLQGVVHLGGINTFTGTATTSNGMSGNVTGRFYGPPIAAATGTKVAGSPPELGGTFAVVLPGVGSLEGSFGAQ